MRALCAALMFLLTAGMAQAAVLPLKHGVGLHEWLNWSPLTADKSYRWPPYRSEAEWLAADRPLSDWPPGDQFKRIRALGFDFVRLSVDPGPLLASDGARRQQALDVLEADVTRITATGLKVVFNLQSVTQVPAYGPDVINAPADSPGIANYRDMVVGVAAMLLKVGVDKVAIEPFNEPSHYPCDGGGTDDWQRIAASTVAAVRAVSPDLTIVITGACGGDETGLLNLDPSFDDPDIYYSFHMYDPHSFTHQRLNDDPDGFASGLPWPASAGSPAEAIANLRAHMTAAGVSDVEQAMNMAKVSDAIAEYFKENWGEPQLEAEFDGAAAWAKAHGIPPSRIFVGEFGAILMSKDGRQGAFDADRLRYLTAVRQAAERYGMPWSIWEYSNPYGMTVILPDGPADPDRELLDALGLKGTTAAGG